MPAQICQCLEVNTSHDQNQNILKVLLTVHVGLVDVVVDKEK